MDTLSDYTIRGALKFDNAAAEFGINFYAQWPDTAQKYMLMRESDGLARLYYCSSAGSCEQLGSALDTVDSLNDNDALIETDSVYEYEIVVSPTASEEQIKVYVWKSGKTKPAGAGIFGSNVNVLGGGLVGFVTSTGTGTRYWNDLIVTANDPYDGAFMANETFASDSVVDIKPYVPASWHPDYEHVLLATGTDTTGFVYDPTEQALVYRHKEGVEYPVTCRLAPNTNLEWESYVDSGMVIKPADTVYNSVSVGVVVYGQNDDDRYLLNFTPSGVYLDGGGINNEYVDSMAFDPGDTLFYRVQVQTFDVDTASDSIVTITAEAWIGNNGSKQLLVDAREDSDDTRVVNGYPGISLDYSGIAAGNILDASPIRIQKAWVRKMPASKEDL
jgi:hypothetical protein